MKANQTRNKQVLRTRQWIFDALFSLMKTKSLGTISITDVAQRAGVSRQSIYRNFSCIEEILIQFFEELFVSFVNNVKNANINASSKVYIAFFAEFYVNKDKVLVIQRSGGEDLLIKILWNFQSRFLNPNDNTIEKYGKKYQLAGVVGVTVEWIQSGMNIDPDKLGEILEEVTKKLKDETFYLPNSL